MSNAEPGTHRHRWRGAHKQVSEIRWVDVPAQRGVGAHRDALVRTACGREVPTTLASPKDEHVRCPDCRTAMAGDGHGTHADLPDPVHGGDVFSRIEASQEG